MFTVARKSIKLSASREPSECGVVNLLRKLTFSNSQTVTAESWCVLGPNGSLVCMCVNESDANMVEIALNRTAR